MKDLFKDIYESHIQAFNTKFPDPIQNVKRFNELDIEEQEGLRNLFDKIVSETVSRFDNDHRVSIEDIEQLSPGEDFDAYENEFQVVHEFAKKKALVLIQESETERRDWEETKAMLNRDAVGV